MTPVNYKEANRRYRWLFLPAMAMYAVAIFAGVWLNNTYDTVWTKAVAGLAAGIPLVIAIWALMRFVRETDDYNRQLNYQAATFAGAVTASIAILIGFLQMYDAAPMFPAFWFGIVYFMSFGFGHMLNHWAGKAGGCAPDAE